MKYLLTIVISLVSLLTIHSCSITPDKEYNLAGGYSKYDKVSKEELQMFEDAIHSYDSTLCLTPQKVSRQVVAGMNYKFECADKEKRTCVVKIFKPLPGQGIPRVISID